MADFLIQHLTNKAREHSALAMLVNQWGFDEQLIPKALQNVSSLFPHYSRHDESHSKQILINIERLLGNSIVQLTATDTWLLLEAAYWHDIGMVVLQKDIKEAFNHKDFPAYLDQIRNAPHHELHRFTLSFNFQDMTQCFAGADTPIEAVDKFRQLMAEWFRRQHAERSSKTIENPWASAAISSPRTELIPARLFKLLGRVCHQHGLPFKDILAPTGLPYREAGLAQEDCHPRFVACLLRMGDLLDLDDNRFCPVMQGIAGDKRPRLSKAHEDKHASIRHLRIDRDRIEVTSECETVEGYLESFKWFDWLKQEMQNQMSHWQDIVPSRDFGLLPTLGSFEVRLSGEQQILKEGQRPQFSIDGEQAIELLQGNNLYDSRFACIRELLQNAVDATLLRLWLTHEKTENREIWRTPFSERAQAILKASQVEVTLEESAPDTDTPNDKTHWILKIKDEGTGISREDLSYMIRIGDSQNNEFRQTKINTMPEWMKPSGTFGIGFQSVYMICDVVKLMTKSIFTNETLEVTMHNPLGKKEGLVVLKPLANDVSRPCGTTLEISLSYNKENHSHPKNIADATSLGSQFLYVFDPVLDEPISFEPANIGDQIHEFSKNSLLPIHGKLTRLKTPKPFKFGTIDDDESSSRDWNFLENYQLALRYIPNLEPPSLPMLGKSLYRGQKFEQKVLREFQNVWIEINLFSGIASYWLTTNRDQLANKAEDEFRKLVLDALEQQVRNDLNTQQFLNDLNAVIENDITNKMVYSYFLEAMAINHGDQWRDLADKFGDAWLDLPISFSDKIKFRDLFSKSEWTLGDSSFDECDLAVNPLRYGHSEKEIFINQWLKSKTNTIQVIETKTSSIFSFRYLLKTKPQPSYNKKALAQRLAEVMDEKFGNRRYWLDFPDNKWSALHLRETSKFEASYLFDIPPPQNKKCILLPFLFSNQSDLFGPDNIKVIAELDELCKWVKPRLEIDALLKDIREEYDKLIDHIDNIMKQSSYWVDWKTARGLN